MRKLAISLILLSIIIFVACSGGGGGGSSSVVAVQNATITGSAVKGPIEGAQINLFYFNVSGNEVEIDAAGGQTVTTESDGTFVFPVDGPDLMGITSPLLVRTTGGTMNGGVAPQLEAIIADPMPLTFAQVSVACHLSVASSVAAGLLKRMAQANSLPPAMADAQQVMSRVENELNVDLSADPAAQNTTLHMLNLSIDQNLDLADTPANNPRVEDFIAYLIANLSSLSGVLDSSMDDPGSPGSDVPASFAPFGTLASVVATPADFLIMHLEADTEFIENDGSDQAYITATLTNAQGQPAVAVDQVLLGLSSGPGSMTLQGYDYGQGQVQADLISDTTGVNVVQAQFTLPNTETIAEQILVTAVDLVVDSDGDGFADGEEHMGWEIVVDTLGYGTDGDGRLLIIRLVTSDPNLPDTDGDGLDDYVEYLAGTDPRMLDTDGDGLTDAAEWHRWNSSPTSVDTDGDARGPDHNLPPKAELFDGNELFLFATSPTLDDTDGDGRTDYEELDHPSRSPLVADLPRMELDVVDNVDVRLDVAYAEEAGQTKEYGTELMQSQTLTASRSSSTTMGHSVSIGAGYEGGILGGPSFSTEYTFSYENTVSFSAEASQTAARSYSQYATDARTHTESSASGTLTMGILLKNTGNVTYTLSQFGITARQWVPEYDPFYPSSAGRFKTVATLIPVLSGGITLAPGAESSVLQIQAANVNAARIKAFLARPDSLYLEPAYYELENAEGLNFAYLEEITGSRTALVTIDFGDGRTEAYRVATNVERHADGSYAGVDMETVMTELLEIPFDTRARQFIYPGAATNEEILFVVRDTVMDPLVPDNGFWSVVLSGTDGVPGWVDFQDVILHAGEHIHLMFLKDEDRDGLISAEEQHYRTDEGAGDSDGDGLTDVEEVRGQVFLDPAGNQIPCGWIVSIDGPAARSYPVISDPALVDEDGDGVNDLGERDKGTDPHLADTDSDGIPDSSDRHPLYPAKTLRVKADAPSGGDGSSWETAIDNLQTALQLARSGYTSDSDPADDVAEIWVASGVYKPAAAGDQTTAFQPVNDLGLFGGFSGVETRQAQRNTDPVTNATVLSGDLQGNDAAEWGDDPASFDDNSYTVVVYLESDAIGSTTVLDGFMVTGGNNATGSGGGIYSDGLPTLRNLFVRVNHAYEGAGMAIRAKQAGSMTVSNCIFDSNLAGGGNRFGGGLYSRSEGSGVGHNYHLVVRDCIFRTNSANYGGGLYAFAQRLTVEGCQFNANNAFHEVQTDGGGGGMSVSLCRVDIDRTRFDNNFAWNHGGGLEIDGDANWIEITQSVFWGNTVYNWLGGGLYETYSASNQNSIWIINSVFANNYSNTAAVDSDDSRYGGGIMVDNPIMRVENSILWGNATARQLTVYQILANQISAVDFSRISLKTSDIQNATYAGLTAIAGNIDADPAFVNVTAGDLRLNSGSPCIDRGNSYIDYEPMTPGFSLLPETDLGGDPRIVDGNGDSDATVDMGPFEYQGG